MFQMPHTSVVATVSKSPTARSRTRPSVDVIVLIHDVIGRRDDEQYAHGGDRRLFSTLLMEFRVPMERVRHKGENRRMRHRPRRREDEHGGQRTQETHRDPHQRKHHRRRRPRRSLLLLLGQFFRACSDLTGVELRKHTRLRNDNAKNITRRSSWPIRDYSRVNRSARTFAPRSGTPRSPPPRARRQQPAAYYLAAQLARVAASPASRFVLMDAYARQVPRPSLKDTSPALATVVAARLAHVVVVFGRAFARVIVRVIIVPARARRVASRNGRQPRSGRHRRHHRSRALSSPRARARVTTRRLRSRWIRSAETAGRRHTRAPRRSIANARASATTTTTTTASATGALARGRGARERREGEWRARAP